MFQKKKGCENHALEPSPSASEPSRAVLDFDWGSACFGWPWKRDGSCKPSTGSGEIIYMVEDV